MHIEQIPAYLTWPLRQEVMYPEKTIEQVKLPDDESGMHFGLFDDHTLISVISWFNQGTDAQFRKFATRQPYQGKGYGTTLLKFIIEFSRSENCARLWCNSREQVAPFYERFGFRKTDQQYQADGYRFIVMELILDSSR